MATLSLLQHFTVTIDGETYDGGSTTVAQTITVAGETLFDRTYSIVDSTITEVFQAGATADDDLTDWEFIYMVSAADAEVRIIVDKGADVGIQGMVLPLRAGVPQLLTGGDVSRTNANVDGALAADWISGADVIDAIEVYQASGSAAKFRIFAVR